MDPAGEFAQLDQGRLQLACGIIESCESDRVDVWAKPRARESQSQQHRHEPLLRTVMEVSLEAASLGDRGFDDLGPRLPKLLLCRTLLAEVTNDSGNLVGAAR